MPILNKLPKRRLPESNQLKMRLTAEWRNPRIGGEPLIVEEGGGRQPVRLYVIWSDWGQLNQNERSEMVMDVYEEIRGTKRALDVTLALGLTPIEAQKLGIELSAEARGGANNHD